MYTSILDRGNGSYATEYSYVMNSSLGGYYVGAYNSVVSNMGPYYCNKSNCYSLYVNRVTGGNSYGFKCNTWYPTILFKSAYVDPINGLQLSDSVWNQSPVFNNRNGLYGYLHFSFSVTVISRQLPGRLGLRGCNLCMGSGMH